MEQRRSIDVAGAKHVNPIPSASRRGPFVASGAISGADPETGKVPDDLDEQCRLMFENVRRVMAAAPPQASSKRCCARSSTSTGSKSFPTPIRDRRVTP